MSAKKPEPPPFRPKCFLKIYQILETQGSFSASNLMKRSKYTNEVIRMKKILAAALALLMLLGCAAAEEQTTTVLTPEMGAAVSVDLDGDGAQEQLTWNTVEISEYDTIAEIRVQTADGAEIGWGSDLLYNAQVYICDIDADGTHEIFVSGDEMSDDYVTYVLRCTGSALQQLPFADVCRGENTGGYYDRGYGRVTAIEGCEISLTGSQDMLGTWFATRRFMLLDGQFEIVDDGYWICDVDINDTEAWQYRSLNPISAIPVTFVENYQMFSGELQPGERILLTRFDKFDAFFVTEDGRHGFLTAHPDEENGWGWAIDGVSEYELFETLPYAD